MLARAMAELVEEVIASATAVNGAGLRKALSLRV